MSAINVNNTAGLQAALLTANPGDNIVLAPGVYSPIVIQNYTNNSSTAVNITSRSASNPAVLQGVMLSNSSGVEFSNVIFSTVGTVNLPGVFANPFTFTQDQHLVLNNITVEGSSLIDPDLQPNGLYIHNSSNVVLQNSDFQYVHVGLTEIGNSNISIMNNSFEDMGSDGIDNAQANVIKISGNTFTDFDNTTNQHPDAIQFWTTGTTVASSNITVSNNVITRGDGNTVQGIFIADEVGNLAYRNLVITGNVVVGEDGNGIEVNHGQNIQMSNNDVLSYSDLLSRVVLMNDTNVTETGDHSSKFIYQNLTNLVTAGDTTTTALSPNFAMTAASGAVGAGLQGLVLTGVAGMAATANDLGDTIIGNNANNTLIGGAGNDTLIGGSGNNVFKAGAGNDVLVGGTGQETFVFDTNAAADTITDFTEGAHDTIDISAILKAGSHAILQEVKGNAIISFDHNTSTITLLGVDFHTLIPTATGYTV